MVRRHAGTWTILPALTLLGGDARTMDQPLPFILVRYTALLVLSTCEAYVAGSTERKPRGLDGEWYLARVLHTVDGGLHWRALPWRRTFFSRLRHPGFPNWPPEFVLGMRRTDDGLFITHRDEWVPFEPGGESLWEARFDGVNWSVRRLRFMDYETKDSPALVPEIDLASLPTSIQPPNGIPRC